VRKRKKSKKREKNKKAMKMGFKAQMD